LNRSNIHFKLCGLKSAGKETTAILVAEDKSNNRRVPAYDLTSALSQPYVKSQLDNMGILSVTPKVKPSPEQVRLYLDIAPHGIDPRVWIKAQQDNPNPSSMIPVPILGTQALKNKALWQESENKQHQARIKLAKEEVSALKTRYGNLNAEMEQLKRRHYNITHRILKAIIRYDITKNEGQQIQPVEEALAKLLKIMDNELNAPTKCKGQIKQLMSEINLQKLKISTAARTEQKRDVLHKDAIPKIKEVLSTQQKSTEKLVETTDLDLKNLNRMKYGIGELVSKIKNP